MSELTSVEKSFAILKELIGRGETSPTELAEQLDIPTSTVHDHLLKLNDIGMVSKANDRYEPSTRILELAEYHRRSMEIYEHAKPELQDLTNETGEHATLMIEEDGLGVLIYTTESDSHIKFAPHPGSRLKLHRTGEGKAILAHLPSERIIQILNEYELDTRVNRTIGDYKIPHKTDATITDKEELLDELETIREQKYAFGREELINGIRSIGAPIVSQDGEVRGAIGIYSPVSKLDNETFNEDFPEKLLHKTNIIEVNLNYT